MTPHGRREASVCAPCGGPMSRTAANAKLRELSTKIDGVVKDAETGRISWKAAGQRIDGYQPEVKEARAELGVAEKASQYGGGAASGAVGRVVSGADGKGSTVAPL